MSDVTRYVTVNLPIPLAEEVDKIVKDERNGFRSRNEFVVDAVRKHLIYYKNNGKTQQ